jgi:hypothetical protein
MTAQVQTLTDALYWDGHHRLHWLQMGPPSIEVVQTLVAERNAEMPEVRLATWDEPDLGIWHMQAIWEPRGELVKFNDRLAVAWTIDKGQRVSEVIEKAAWWFYTLLDRTPGRAVMGRMPGGRTEVSYEYERQTLRLALASDPQAPLGCVMVLD